MSDSDRMSITETVVMLPGSKSAPRMSTRPSSPTIKSEVELHSLDALAVFAPLFERGWQLTPARILSRRFSEWLRSFIADKIGLQAIRPGRQVSTRSIVALLAAKAKVDGGELSVDLFKFSIEIILKLLLDEMRRVSLEAELVWHLFDVERNGRITVEAFDQLLDVWAALGVSCEAWVRDHFLNEARENCMGFLTEDLYYVWCEDMKIDTLKDLQERQRRYRPWREYHAPSALVSGRIARPGDQTMRSKEVASLSLQRDAPPYLLGESLQEPVRQPTPATTLKRKIPGAQGRATFASEKDSPRSAPSTSLSASLPPVRPRTAPAIDPEKQEESWNRRQMRLRPNMKVLVSYSGPDGGSKSARGTLLSGWGRPLTADPKIEENQDLIVEVFGVERRVPREAILVTVR